MRRSCSIISVKNRFRILKNIRCFEVFVVVVIGRRKEERME